MAGDWSALLKELASPVLRRFPGWVLRRWYPVGKCVRHLTVWAHGMGPHVYINPGRSPALVGLNLTLMNELPFAVSLEDLHLEFHMESRTLTNHEQGIGEVVPAGTMRQISVKDIHLSDGQVSIVGQFPGECPILRMAGHLSCASVVGEFKKSVQTETRAFIYRRGDNG